MNQKQLRIGALAILVGLVLGPGGAFAAKRGPTFTLTDPRGDDHGDGTLTYPGRPDFQAGDLDLVALTATPQKDGTLFEATFARPIRAPQRQAVDSTGQQLDSIARFGFYTFNIDIYIDTDRIPGSGGVAALPGRNVEISPDNAWDRAICLTPRPHAARGELKRLLMRDLRQELRTTDSAVSDEQARDLKLRIPEEVENRVFFPTQVRTTGRKIQFFVPGSALGGPAQDTWSYVVVVSGADVVQSIELAGLMGRPQENDNLMVLQRAVGHRQDVFGGGREDDPFQTPLVDIIVPDGLKQEGVLMDYDRRAGRGVALQGVVPAEAGKPRERATASL